MTNTQSVPGIPADGIPGGSRKVTEAPRLRALGGNATDRALMDGVLANPPLPTPPTGVCLPACPSTARTSMPPH